MTVNSQVNHNWGLDSVAFFHIYGNITNFNQYWPYTASEQIVNLTCRYSINTNGMSSFTLCMTTHTVFFSNVLYIARGANFISIAAILVKFSHYRLESSNGYMHISNKSGTKILPAHCSSIVNILDTIRIDTTYVATNSSTSNTALGAITLRGAVSRDTTS